jgi:pSer/pThr/pTyr-binding forkhead associated (FHA) protein
MRDGHTQKLSSSATNSNPQGFFAKFSATIVVVAGGAVGTEFVLAKTRTLLGRGPAVDIVIDDATMSRQHAAFDLVADGIRVQDLGSTNGVLLNGRAVESTELKHGDRLKIGEHEFQFLLEERDRQPRTYIVSD